MTPTVMYVVPPNNYYIISQGMMVVNVLEERLLVAAENANMLSSAQLAALYPDRSQLIPTQALKDGANPDDPVELVRTIREKILSGASFTPTGAAISNIPQPQPSQR